MPDRCDNQSVGALICDRRRYLMFNRNTPPAGVAPAAGHIDDHGGPKQALHAEVREELGLTVTAFELLAKTWLPNRCRRAPGREGVGHHWHVYEVDVTGQLAPSARETADVRWLTAGEIQGLAERTALYAHRRMTAAEFAESPGLEPAWVRLLAGLHLIRVAEHDLRVIDRLAAADPNIPGVRKIPA